jgi:hypothetical protein
MGGGLWLALSADTRRLLVYDVPMKKKVGKKLRRKGLRISTARLFSTFRPKDPCYGPLAKESQERAVEADRMGNLDLLDGQLRCECGKMVGAKRSAMGSYFEPDPRPHERYKEPRQPARKRGPEKRTPR